MATINVTHYYYRLNSFTLDFRVLRISGGYNQEVVDIIRSVSKRDRRWHPEIRGWIVESHAYGMLLANLVYAGHRIAERGAEPDYAKWAPNQWQPNMTPPRRQIRTATCEYKFTPQPMETD